jgi:hypothetical protein
MANSTLKHAPQDTELILQANKVTTIVAFTYLSSGLQGPPPQITLGGVAGWGSPLSVTYADMANSTLKHAPQDTELILQANKVTTIVAFTYLSSGLHSGRRGRLVKMESGPE